MGAAGTFFPPIMYRARKGKNPPRSWRKVSPARGAIVEFLGTLKRGGMGGRLAHRRSLQFVCEDYVINRC